MSINSRVVYKVVKWTVAVLSYAFLVYILLTFDSYSELFAQWSKSLSGGRLGWLLLVFLLWPVNLSLESVKWRILTAKLQRLGFGQAFLSVLAGDVAAVFSPNRLGEVAGRCMFLNEENRLKGISLTVSNGVSQTLAICLFGVPSLVLSAVAYGKDGDKLACGLVRVPVFGDTACLCVLAEDICLPFGIESSSIVGCALPGTVVRSYWCRSCQGLVCVVVQICRVLIAVLFYAAFLYD